MAYTNKEAQIVNDALSVFLEQNADGKWERHFGTWDSIVWKEDATDLPTESDYTSQKSTLEANERAKIERVYPSIGDQLDMMYHDQLDGTTTWKDAIAKVKADNPKSE